ncbi:MAG: glycosyltransferase [Planctomycetota bacterium]
MARLSNTFVSVVVPCRNDADLLDGFIDELAPLLQRTYQNYEVVLVDDGSDDATAILATGILERHQCLRYLRLTRAHGPEIAILAGLDVVIGDVIVVLEVESDPPARVPDMVTAALDRNGIVFGLRRHQAPEPWLYTQGRRIFLALVRRMLGIALPEKASLFMAFTRQTLNAVIRIKDKSRALRVFGLLVGFPHATLEYEPIVRRATPRKKSLAEGCERAVDLIVTNSSRPLRYAAYLGLAASALNVAYIGYVVVVNLFKPDVEEGWTTLSLQNAGMFLFLFVILTVLAEYVGRLLAETRDRPLYFVAEERSSSVMIPDEERRNVVYEAAEGLGGTEE